MEREARFDPRFYRLATAEEEAVDAAERQLRGLDGRADREIAARQAFTDAETREYVRRQLARGIVARYGSPSAAAEAARKVVAKATNDEWLKTVLGEQWSDDLTTVAEVIVGLGYLLERQQSEVIPGWGVYPPTVRLAAPRPSLWQRIARWLSTPRSWEQVAKGA